MKCPKCGNKKITTPSVNYSYYCGEDKTYFKICPFCNSEHEGKDITDCPNCGGWLPNFPTSWIRSVTNIYTLRKVSEMLLGCSGGSCSDEGLAKILAKENLVTVDQGRLQKMGRQYWVGGPKRRASEYSANLRFLGLATKIDLNTKLNYFGNKFAKVKTKLEFNAICIRTFLRLKITNKFDVIGTYNDYKIRPIFLMLKIISDLKEAGKTVYLENLALALMCKDEKEDYAKALNYSLEYDRKFIYDTFFSKGREYKRVVHGVFSHWLEQVGLIDRTFEQHSLKIEITKLGEEIYKKYSKIEPLFDYDYEFIEEELKEVNKDILNFDISYDLKDEDIKKLSSQMDLDKIEIKLIDGELKIIEKDILIYSNENEKKTLNMKVSSLKRAEKTGQGWEEAVYDMLEELNLEPKWYKKEKTFSHIVLSDEILNSLTGGTQHNPDIIMFNPLFLVDPKKDANIEMYKVFAYDKYATHPEVNANALIVSNIIMRSNLADRIKLLKKTSVIDKYALDVVVNNKDFFNPTMVRKLFGEKRLNGEYIDEEFVFEFAEKEKVVN